MGGIMGHLEARIARQLAEFRQRNAAADHEEEARIIVRIVNQERLAEIHEWRQGRLQGADEVLPRWNATSVPPEQGDFLAIGATPVATPSGRLVQPASGYRGSAGKGSPEATVTDCANKRSELAIRKYQKGGTFC